MTRLTNGTWVFTATLITADLRSVIDFHAEMKELRRDEEGHFGFIIHPVPNEPDLLPDPVLDHNAMSVIKQRQMAPN